MVSTGVRVLVCACRGADGTTKHVGRHLLPDKHTVYNPTIKASVKIVQTPTRECPQGSSDQAALASTYCDRGRGACVGGVQQKRFAP